MAHFLLIHGAWHGAWCWRDLIPELETRGHSVLAIDLPSHGTDPCLPEDVGIEDYVSAVVAVLKSKTILVAHSLGGLTATLVADRVPARVAALVYLCALIPRSGQALKDFRRECFPADLRFGVFADRERGVSLPKPSRAGEFFYTGCDVDTLAYAATRLTPESYAISEEVLSFSPPTMPCHYIRCLKDRTVRPEYQVAVSSDWPVTQVHEMDSGHSPFFSHPAKLAEILDQVART